MDAVLRSNHLAAEYLEKRHYRDEILYLHDRNFGVLAFLVYHRGVLTPGGVLDGEANCVITIDGLYSNVKWDRNLHDLAEKKFTVLYPQATHLIWYRTENGTDRKIIRKIRRNL